MLLKRFALAAVVVLMCLTNSSVACDPMGSKELEVHLMRKAGKVTDAEANVALKKIAVEREKIRAADAVVRARAEKEVKRINVEETAALKVAKTKGEADEIREKARVEREKWEFALTVGLEKCG